MSGLWGSPWKVHRADPTDLRSALPTPTPADRSRAIVLTRIGLRPGDNTDLLQMLGLIPTISGTPVPHTHKKEPTNA